MIFHFIYFIFFSSSFICAPGNIPEFSIQANEERAIKNLLKTSFIDKIKRNNVKMLNKEWNYILSHDIVGWPQNVPRKDHQTWSLEQLLTLVSSLKDIDFIVKTPQSMERYRNMIDQHLIKLLEDKMGYKIPQSFDDILHVSDLINYPIDIISELDSEDDAVIEIYRRLRDMKLTEDIQRINQLDEKLRQHILNYKICEEQGVRFIKFDWDYLNLTINPSEDVENWSGNDISSRQVDFVQFIRQVDPKTFERLTFTPEFLVKLWEEVFLCNGSYLGG